MEDNYNKLKQKHNLPAYDVLDKEFEISTIDEENFLLRSIRKKIAEKIEFSIKLFDDMLHPDAGFASYRESSIFNTEEREAMANIIKKLMFYNRLSTELSFDDSDEQNAGFIRSFMDDWPDLKKQIISFVRKLKDSWQKDVSKKEVVGYLG
jgi:hypothetical protein